MKKTALTLLLLACMTVAAHAGTLEQMLQFGKCSQGALPPLPNTGCDLMDQKSAERYKALNKLDLLLRESADEVVARNSWKDPYMPINTVFVPQRQP